MKIETRAVHAGRHIDPATGAVTAPIYLSTTFQRGPDGGYPLGFSYSRDGNPNRLMLEKCLADLEGGKEALFAKEARDSREELYNTILEMLKNGTIREFKRIICFDHDVLENDRELEAGILRVGEGPGTIDSLMGDHCRLLLRNKGCSLYVAPVVFRAIVGLYGVDKASITVDTVDQGAGARRVAGVLVFHDPPNGEIIEQFRQIVRTTERRMVAVREIRFSEDTAQTAELATR